MCEISWMPKLLVWTFVGTTLVLALISRRLNGHLLLPPTSPTGPFAFLLRRKYHVRPSFLFDPARHFAPSALGLVRIFGALLLFAAGLLLVLALSGSLCGWRIGPAPDGPLASAIGK